VRSPVRLEERGPARMRMRQRDRHGDELELGRDDPSINFTVKATEDPLPPFYREPPGGPVSGLVMRRRSATSTEAPLGGYLELRLAA
jgi:hypothetical protein